MRGLAVLPGGRRQRLHRCLAGGVSQLSVPTFMLYIRENRVISKQRTCHNGLPLLLPDVYIIYYVMYQIRRPLGLVFVIYFWWLGELLLLYI
jgi:hypothetical protein